jgi:GH15 family glucan-1,4-alpha-glucosidase
VKLYLDGKIRQG